MAVKKCCVEKCKSCSTRKEDKGVTYHKFPKDATSRNEWQFVTHYKHTDKNLSAFVCSRHFCKGNFQKNKDSKYILNSDAVPSIFPWTIDTVNMDTFQIEGSLSSIFSEDGKNQSSSSKGSEVENVDAIKKFIEEQEKEIQEKELQDKEDLKKKMLDYSQNVQECSKNVDANKEEIEKENIDIASSVMDMILSESEAKIAKKSAEEIAKDAQLTPKQELCPINKKDQKIMSPNDKGNATMSLSVGSKVEVKDFGEDWYPAEVAEVDCEEMEVLVRYAIDTKKLDEWISVSSPRLRPFTGTTTNPSTSKEPDDPPKEKNEAPQEKSTKVKPSTSKEKAPLLKEKALAPKEIKREPIEDIVKVEEKPKVVFEVGERCFARWRDNRRFVATIHKDLGDGTFEVMFDDGFFWKCSLIRLRKMKSEKDTLTVDTSFQSATAGSPSPLDLGAGTSNPPRSPSIPPAFHTHLFDPARDYLGSKSERREKKRKLNIKEIFNIGQKKAKTPKVEKEKTPVTAVAKKPRVVRKNVTPKRPKVVPKKEMQAELPDAVASIIGTKELEIKLEPFSHKSVVKEKNPNMASKKNYEIEKSTAGDGCITYNNIKEEIDDMDVDNMESISCVVNPNDKTLDDEDMEEPKSDGDPVLEEEVTLENFEKQDTEKHDAVIDRIKEAIIKLEGGILDMQNVDSPKVERVDTPKCEIEVPEPPETKEAKIEDLKDALAEAAASVSFDDSNTELKESSNVEVVNIEKSNVPKAKVPKSKRDPSKIKKAKKLRLLQEKKVKKQVEKVKNELEEMKKQFEEMRKHMLVKTKELVQSDNRPLPESCLREGEWCCRWVNGQPVGKVSEIEGAVQMGVDNKPVLPRRSVEVEDKRLPAGWSKHMVRRSVGNSAGKWDVVFVSPDEHGNKRFHMKTDMRNFLEHFPDDSLKPYEHALTDFGVHLKISRRMGWIVNTPDGIAEAPETILPADATCPLSPLVKRKSLNLKKRNLLLKDKKRGLLRPNKKRRPIKLKLQKRLHTYNSELVGSESSGEVQGEIVDTFQHQPPLLPLEDGYEYVGTLKVQIIDNLLRCPAETCFKNFRTKTLLQMHIKHYHRELTRMMGATPKVLDLAYARTMPLETDLPQVDKKIIKVKINKPMKREEPKILLSEPEISMDDSPASPVDSEITAPVIPRIPRSQDSPKLRQALIHKPVKRPRVLLPVRRVEPDEAVPDTGNDDVFENRIEPVIEIPTLQQALDFETAISTHTVTKPLEKKKKTDKKKCFASFSKNISEDEDWLAMNSDDLDTRSSYPRSGSPDSKIMDTKMAPLSSESNDDQKDPSLYTLTETGERIKIVHMKREEIINCHCGFREEDGLMVQCELCLCWQHALCHNIQRECQVPEKYTCSICLSPRRGRRSQRFLHDQDRMYEGLLPGARPCRALRRSHELAGNLLRLADALHALRLKYYVATKKDHPKLYLWAKDWEQPETTYTQEKLNSEYSELSVMMNGLPPDKENDLNKEQAAGLELSAPTLEEQDPQDSQDADRLSQSARESQLGSQALLSGLLSSPGGASIDLPISTSELERLAKSVQESEEWRQRAAPQPEAPIEGGACGARLRRHLARAHARLDARLDSIEAQVAELESQDPSFGEHYETAEFYPRTKQTIQMLMRDLDTMEELGFIT